MFVLCLPDWNEPLNFDAESRSSLVRGFHVTPYRAKRGRKSRSSEVTRAGRHAGRATGKPSDRLV